MAVTPVILQDDSGQIFAVGLEWKRIVVSGSGLAAEQSGYEFANKAGSNRLTFTKDVKGDEVRGVGHAKFAKGDFEALSLAQAFALRHGPTERAVCAIPLNDDLVWVCAVSEGMVVNGYDLVASEAEALERIRELSKRYPDGALVHFGDGALLPEAQILTLQELQDMARQHASDCRMQPTRKNQVALRKTVSILVVLCLIVGAKYAFDQYRRYRVAETARLAALAAKPQISAQQAWDKGLGDWLEGSSQATPRALGQLLDGLSAVRTEISGWELQEVACSRAKTRWGCTANFQRPAATRVTTAQFLASLPAGWKADWGGVDKAVARFGFDAEANKVSLTSLGDSKETLLPLLGHLQHNSRAFGKVEIGQAVAVPVVLPKNPDGSAIVIDPAKVKPIVVATEVVLNGPMRSFYKMLDQPISWKSIRLDISRTAIADSPSKSRLMVTEAKGDVYAIK